MPAQHWQGHCVSYDSKQRFSHMHTSMHSEGPSSPSRLHLTLVPCSLLESMISHFSLSCCVRRVTMFTGTMTRLFRIRVPYYHISTGESHIINRIYPHLLCKSSNSTSLCLCLITSLNRTYFSGLTLPGLAGRNV